MGLFGNARLIRTTGDASFHSGKYESQNTFLKQVIVLEFAEPDFSFFHCCPISVYLFKITTAGVKTTISACLLEFQKVSI